jgi:hypothetical protein
MLLPFNYYSKSAIIAALGGTNDDYYLDIADDVERIWRSLGGFEAPGTHFNDLYSLTVQKTMDQFEKNKIRWMKKITDACEDVEQITKIVRTRLVSNLGVMNKTGA